MMGKFSGLNPKRLYVSLEKEKQNFCVVLTNSIKRACEISCRSRATTAKNCTKKRDARAKMFFLPISTFCFFAVRHRRCKNSLLLSSRNVTTMVT